MILACVIAAPAAAAAPIPLARDLQAEAAAARARDVPLVLFFTEPGCPYCRKARTVWLEPMHNSPAYRRKASIVEIDIRDRSAMRGFAGESTTAAQVAGGYRVRAVPTVLVVDGGGRPATDALVGLMSDDFYGYYLDAAIDAGLAVVRSARLAR